MAYDSTSAEKALRLLPEEVLLEIISAAELAKVNFEKLKTIKNMLIDSINISLLPLKNKREVLEAQIKSTRESIQVLPVETIALSPQLGRVNVDFEAALAGKIEGATNIIFEIDRLTSVRIGITAEIAQYNSSIEYLNNVISSINKVLSTN